MLSFIPSASWVGLVLAIIAVIIGFVGLRTPSKHSRSFIGLILGGIALVLSIVFGIVYAVSGAGTSPVSSDSGSQSASSGSKAAPATKPKAPAPKVNPYDDAYGTFTTIKKSGRGDSVIHLPSGFDAGLITAKYSGNSNFIIDVLDSDNQNTGDGPVNTIGHYSGQTVIGFDDLGGDDAALKVQASGRWSITLAPISTASTTVPRSGRGDAIFLYDGAATDWAFTARGQSNFIVNEYDNSPFPGIGINEIGHYSGTDPVDAGPAVVEVVADGESWTLDQ